MSSASPSRFPWALARLLLVLFVFLASAATTILIMRPTDVLEAQSLVPVLAAGALCAAVSWQAIRWRRARPIAAVLVGAYAGGLLLFWTLMVMFLMGYWPFPTMSPRTQAPSVAAAGAFLGGLAAYLLCRRAVRRGLSLILERQPLNLRDTSPPHRVGQENIPTPVPAELAASGRLQQHLLVSIVQGAIAMVLGAVALATVGLLAGLVAGFIVITLAKLLWGGEPNVAPVLGLFLGPLGAILGGIIGGMLGVLWYRHATRKETT